MAPHTFPAFDRRTMNQLLVAGAAGAITTSFGGLARAANWEKFDEEDGISVYRKDMSGTPLHAFRGVATIAAPMEKVMWVLADNEHRAEWVDRLKKSAILERKSPYDYVVYQHFGSPPLVSDRDFVFRARAYGRKDGSAVLSISSVTHPKAPQTVGVRGELRFSSYTLKPVGKGKTHVDVAVALDPKGALPGWVVNLVQKSWPMKTLTGLRSQVKKSYVGKLALPPVRE